jgi:hypothetical protein
MNKFDSPCDLRRERRRQHDAHRVRAAHGIRWNVDRPRSHGGRDGLLRRRVGSCERPYEPTPAAVGGGNGTVLFAASAFHGDSVAAYDISRILARPAGIYHYGFGTPGCLGSHHLDANRPAIVGDPDFAVACDHALPNAIGLGLISDAKDGAGSDPFSVFLTFHVDLAAATEGIAFDFIADGQGQGFANLPVPANASLAGMHYFVQSFWYWPFGCSPSLWSVSSSDALEIVIQSP